MSHGLSPRVLALTVGLALGQAAHAQCDIYWPGIPDFDQKRNTRVYPDNPLIITHMGLPNGGRVHCVPTSIANLLAVLDDAGYNVVPNTNHPNWQSQLPLYNTISQLLYDLGEYMDTDDSGTNFSDGTEGMMDWISDRGQGATFIYCSFKADDDKFPRPKRVYQLVKAGWPTVIGYGRYYRDGDELERDGGHALTAVGTLDGCHLMRPQITYKDPSTSNDESRIEQSQFTNVTRTFHRRFWNMDGDNAAVYSFDETFNGSETEPVRVFDSYRYILPLISLGVHPVNPNLLVSFRLPGVFKSSAPSRTRSNPRPSDPSSTASSTTPKPPNWSSWAPGAQGPPDSSPLTSRIDPSSGSPRSTAPRTESCSTASDAASSSAAPSSTSTSSSTTAPSRWARRRCQARFPPGRSTTRRTPSSP